MRLRSLCKLVDGRDWQWEKLFFDLVGRALLSKTSLQLSADGLGCSPSLVVVWPKMTQTVVGLGTPRGFTPRETFLASSLWQPLLTLASNRRPSNTAGSFGSVSSGYTAPFLWVLVRAKFCLWPSRLESLSSSPLKVL